MRYLVERKLEFRTVPPRWEIEAIYDSATDAQRRADLGRQLLDQDRIQGIETRSKGGGKITEYRVRESNTVVDI